MLFRGETQKKRIMKLDATWQHATEFSTISVSAKEFVIICLYPAPLKMGLENWCWSFHMVCTGQRSPHRHWWEWLWKTIEIRPYMRKAAVNRTYRPFQSTRGYMLPRLVMGLPVFYTPMCRMPLPWLASRDRNLRWCIRIQPGSWMKCVMIMIMTVWLCV